MRRLLASPLLWTCMQAAWGGPVPLDDAALSAVGARDGISFAVRLELNREGNAVAPGDSRLWIGQQVDGKTTYTVIKNPTGVIQMFALNISANVAPDGSNYVALTLPSETHFTDVGFESLSVQSDPLAPVTNSLGRFTLNGELQMQGQLRLWAH